MKIYLFFLLPGFYLRSGYDSININNLYSGLVLEPTDMGANKIDRILVEHVPEMLILVTPNGEIRFINRTLEERLGYANGELIGQHVRFLSENLKEDEGLYQTLKSNNGRLPPRFNTVVFTQDRRPVYVDVITRPVRHAGATHVLASMRDIGAVKEESTILEQRLTYDRLLYELRKMLPRVTKNNFCKKINDLLQMFGEVAGADRTYVFLMDEKKLTISNSYEWCAEDVPAFRDKTQNIPVTSLPWWMTRLREQRVVILNDLSQIPPEHKDERRILEDQKIQSLLAAPVSHRNSLLGFIGLDSVRRHREWNDADLYLLRHVSDIVWQMLAVNYAELKPEVDHFEFEQALCNAGVGIWSWDIRAGAVRYSGQWCKMIGYQPQETGSTIDFLKNRIHPDDFNLVLSKLNECIKGNRSNYECEFRISTKDGRWLWVLGQGRVLSRSTDGIAQQIIGTHLDITRHKEAEKQMQLAQTLAENANLARSEFLSTVSHELRTPMTGIIGMAQLLQFETKDPEHKDMVETILQCSDDMMKLVNNMLDLADFQNSGVKLHIVEFNPHKLLLELKQFFTHRAQIKKLEFLMNISPRLPLTLKGDGERIQQILSELLNNAIKYTENGFIKITAYMRICSNTARVFTVCIRDSGIGIPPHKLDEIFEPFIQVDGSPCRVFGGAGLGLSKVQRLVRLMGGSVKVRSVAGRGSIFTVELPLETPADAASSRQNAPLALVIDDEVRNRTVLEKMLQRRGWSVEIGSNGMDAVNRVQEKRFDLVFMDIQMPVLSGLDAVRIIRRKEKEEGLPYNTICAVTAFALPGDREKYLAAGMDEYLSKPLHFEEVCRLISKYKAIDIPKSDVIPAQKNPAAG